ncbi:hypothetical protein DY468_20670 [Rhodopseudomonas sp. BR0M22]|nr:hypothetical protein [Rhodopseudomonas sp. BR0M22]
MPKTKRPAARPGVFVWVQTHYPRHGRARPGHPRLAARRTPKTWMPGTGPGMTEVGVSLTSGA